MNRRDAVAVPWMAKHTRNPLPDRIVWKQDDVRHDTFYWLAVPVAETADRPQITAAIKQQAVTLEGPAGKTVSVRFNDQMLNLDQPVTVTANGKSLHRQSPTHTSSLSEIIEGTGRSALFVQ